MPKAEGKLVLSSELEELGRVEQAVMAAVEVYGYHEHDRFAIKLALEEALANAVKHGNRCDPSKRIVVEYRIDRREARIIVQDEGGGFDPCRVADPTLDENLEKPNGRGVMLMRVYMDDVRFNQPGNSVVLVKRRSEGQAVPPPPAIGR